MTVYKLFIASDQIQKTEEEVLSNEISLACKLITRKRSLSKWNVAKRLRWEEYLEKSVDCSWAEFK